MLTFTAPRRKRKAETLTQMDLTVNQTLRAGFESLLLPLAGFDEGNACEPFQFLAAGDG